MTVPGVRAAIVESITDLERLRLSVGSGPLFAVMSREKAKLSYRWMPAVIQRWAVSKGRLLREEETGEPFRVPCCPDCTAQIVDKDGVPLTFADLNRRKHTCAGCDAPLWQADRSGPARYPLADYIKHRMKGFFDLLIGDEVPRVQGARLGPGHRRGHPRRRVRQVPQPDRDAPGRVLLDHLPPALPVLARRSGRSSGAPTSTAGSAVRLRGGHRRQARRRRGGGRAQQQAAQASARWCRERPGLVPSALFHIIGNTVFLRLADVASGLPDYEEKILVSSMDSEEDATGLLPAQRLQPRVRGAEERS